MTKFAICSMPSQYTHIPMLCLECTKPLSMREKGILAVCNDCEWKKIAAYVKAEMRLAFSL